MKINQKIIMGFFVVALLILAVSYICMRSQENLVKRYQKVAGEILPGTISAAMIHATLHHAVEHMEKYGSTGKVGDREKTEEALAALEEYVAQHKLYHIGHHIPAYIDMIDETIESFTSFTMEYILRKAKGASKEELDIVKEKIDQVEGVFIFQVEPALAEHIKTAGEIVRAAEQSTRRSRGLMLGSSAAIFSLAIIWGFFISRLISKPIRELSEAAGRIGKGQLDIQIEPVSKDEIGQLAISFNRMSKDLQMVTVSRDAFAQEVAEREKAAKALQKSEEKLAGIVDSVTDAMIMVDDQFNVVWNNDIAMEKFGADVVGQKCYSAYHGRDEICKPCIVKECFNDGKVHEFETEITVVDGNLMSLWGTAGVAAWHEDGTPKMVVEFLRDITERKQTEEALRAAYDQSIIHAEQLKKQIEEKEKLQTQLQQAQKMEAMGTLAGGIAHDFNNILTAIMGYTELSLSKTPKEGDLYNYLKEVIKASNRARDLVQHILTFSRQAEYEIRPMNIGIIIKEALKLLRASLPTTIEIRPQIESKIIIEADSTQIHQVLMNLCTNAGHAMRDKGGVLEVSLKKIDVDENLAVQHPDLHKGPYAILTVSDTGTGMTPEVMERVFDPYYSTKEKGKGTGLGLAVVHGIVKILGGAITIESQTGKGSSFSIYIPRIDTKLINETEIIEPIPAGKERILFVDDEKVLADMGKQMLEWLGYTVVTGTSSIEALELFRKQPHEFDLVITDTTMPNMPGDELSKELLNIRSDIPIIICTGYCERITEEKIIEIGIRAIVIKPFELRNMAKTIRKVMDG
ncbi:MAG: ATP-binding protein [Spirochaetales bacterium]|jgi:PAS domain S-box-containing protein|nr:ATP-binding protein [Spirochaetales bacterium]